MLGDSIYINNLSWNPAAIKYIHRACRQAEQRFNTMISTFKQQKGKGTAHWLDVLNLK